MNKINLYYPGYLTSLYSRYINLQTNVIKLENLEKELSNFLSTYGNLSQSVLQTKLVQITFTNIFTKFLNSQHSNKFYLLKWWYGP